MAFVVRWLVSAVALWVTTLVVPGIEVTGSSPANETMTLLAVALIFGLINAFLKPLIKVIGCVVYLLTLGLIALVVNALLFLLTDWVADQFGLPFMIDGFWAAFWGAIVMAVVSWALSLVIPDRAEGKE